jgi:hypothetical protein
VKRVINLLFNKGLENFWVTVWAKWIKSTPSYTLSSRSVLKESRQLCQCFPSGLLPSGYQTTVWRALTIWCVLQNLACLTVLYCCFSGSWLCSRFQAKVFTLFFPIRGTNTNLSAPFIGPNRIGSFSWRLEHCQIPKRTGFVFNTLMDWSSSWNGNAEYDSPLLETF